MYFLSKYDIIIDYWESRKQISCYANHVKPNLLMMFSSIAAIQT